MTALARRVMQTLTIWLLAEDLTWSAVDMSAVPASHLVPGEQQGSSIGLLVMGEDLSQQESQPSGETMSLLLTTDGQTWQSVGSDLPLGGGPAMPLVLGETSLLVGVRGPDVPAPAEMQLWVGTPIQRQDAGWSSQRFSGLHGKECSPWRR